MRPQTAGIGRRTRLTERIARRVGAAVRGGVWLAVLSAALCLAAGDSPPAIEKTFDVGTTVEHTVTMRKGIHRIALRLSQHRTTAGAPAIASAHLDVIPDTSPGSPLLTAPVFEALLTDMMNALHARLGADLKLTSLGAGGFMGIKALEKQSILAFNGFAPWRRYLDDPGSFSQQRIHAIVAARWRSAGVFDAVTDTFARLGYRAEFSGFEKLFVFPAEKCSFYAELEALGIGPRDRFPYPGVIAFTLAPKP